MAKYFTREGDDYKEVTDPLHTQSEVDDIVTKRLDRERSKYSDYDDLKKKAGTVDTLTKEHEEKLKKAGDEKADLEGKLKKANLETDKVKIVGEFKLSDDLAEFVTGDTQDEMRKKAEKLSKGVKPEKVEIDKNPKPEDAKNAGSKAIAGKLFGKSDED